MKLYFHIDNDGKSSAAIVLKALQGVEIELCPYNYWYDNSYFDNIRFGEKVIFVDISPKREVILKILKVTQDVTIIDHHQSTWDELKDYKELGIKGRILNPMEEGKEGACSLVWKYYYPDTEIPIGIQYLAGYDVWNRNEENIKFHHGILSLNLYPKNKMWINILDNDNGTIQYIIRRGKHITDYLKHFYKRILGAYGYKTFITQLGRKYSCFIVNQGQVDSSIFDNIPEADKCDIYLRVARVIKRGIWTVSISTESDHIDVKEIAMQYGGGGHTQASGFTVKDLSELNLDNIDFDIKETETL